MNKEYKEKWLKALRGNEYRQATGALKGNADNDGYCCLGVLCDVSGLGEWADSEFQYQVPEDYLDEDVDSTQSADGDLTAVLLSFFGISMDQQKKLIDMNDEELKNFNEIANWVEQNL